ncbi:MAG: protein translocase SEC61 complex subunit gamma [Thermoplasmata archaeon]|nr:protein translocase SEC61 complex subunit gamma [Thermoplasmata archaeon]
MREKNIIDRAWDVQKRIEDRVKHLGKGKYGRVLKMARKPTEEEYYRTSKITFLGILIIGLIGFVIYILRTLLAPLILSKLGL